MLFFVFCFSFFFFFFLFFVFCLFGFVFIFIFCFLFFWFYFYFYFYFLFFVFLVLLLFIFLFLFLVFGFLFFIFFCQPISHSETQSKLTQSFFLSTTSRKNSPTPGNPTSPSFTSPLHQNHEKQKTVKNRSLWTKAREWGFSHTLLSEGRNLIFFETTFSLKGVDRFCFFLCFPFLSQKEKPFKSTTFTTTTNGC